VAAVPVAARAQVAPAPPSDPVAALARELASGDPLTVGDRARADARILALDPASRVRLLDALSEDTVWWAPLLNLYPGFGVGSLASRDRRGAYLALADSVGFVAMSIGFTIAMGETPGWTEAERERKHRLAVGVAAAGAAVVVGSRIAGVILPFSFRGRRRWELERVLDDAPPGPEVAAFVEPLAPWSHPGAVAGVVLHF
jgi:hypothetical protein